MISKQTYIKPIIWINQIELENSILNGSKANFNGNGYPEVENREVDEKTTEWDFEF